MSRAPPREAFFEGPARTDHAETVCMWIQSVTSEFAAVSRPSARQLNATNHPDARYWKLLRYSEHLVRLDLEQPSPICVRLRDTLHLHELFGTTGLWGGLDPVLSGQSALVPRHPPGSGRIKRFHVNLLSKEGRSIVRRRAAAVRLRIQPAATLLSHADFAEQNSVEVSTEYRSPPHRRGRAFCSGKLSSMPFVWMVVLTIARCGPK